MAESMFSELYSSYYNVVAAILRYASTHDGITNKDIIRITGELAFNESIFEIPAALESGDWNLLTNGKSNLEHIPTMPLTNLQKRWLKSLVYDPRVTLFVDDDSLENLLSDVEPLWTKDDYKVFDSYGNGDFYEDAIYRYNWRCLMDSIKENRNVQIKYVSRYNKERTVIVHPVKMEYSEKNDRFRLIGYTNKGNIIINVSTISQVENMPEDYVVEIENDSNSDEMKTLVLLVPIDDTHNVLERVMLHFAHYEKEAFTKDGLCHLSIKYNVNDEKEMIINVLSFGPLVKVAEPTEFVELIKQKITSQIKVADFFPC